MLGRLDEACSAAIVGWDTITGVVVPSRGKTGPSHGGGLTFFINYCLDPINGSANNLLIHRESNLQGRRRRMTDVDGGVYSQHSW